MPEHAPGPEFEYEEPRAFLLVSFVFCEDYADQYTVVNPHHDSTQSLLNLLRGRSKPEDVLSHLETLKNTMPDTVTTRDGAEVPINISSVIRSITMQSLLHIGARSFSHLLNAIERYLPVLRVLASGTISSSSTAMTGPGAGDADAKADILAAVAEFWRRNVQMVFIVFDKLMQYQIVDPSDVVAWAFTNSARIIGSDKELGNVKSTLSEKKKMTLVRATLPKAVMLVIWT